MKRTSNSFLPSPLISSRRLIYSTGRFPHSAQFDFLAPPRANAHVFVCVRVQLESDAAIASPSHLPSAHSAPSWAIRVLSFALHRSFCRRGTVCSTEVVFPSLFFPDWPIFSVTRAPSMCPCEVSECHIGTQVESRGPQAFDSAFSYEMTITARCPLCATSVSTIILWSKYAPRASVQPFSTMSSGNKDAAVVFLSIVAPPL